MECTEEHKESGRRYGYGMFGKMIGINPLYIIPKTPF